MKIGDLIQIGDRHMTGGQIYEKGQIGFIVGTGDFDSRIRVMIAGKTVWFFHFHLRKLFYR